MLNKVPEITLYFWVIKVLCTTVGETASDYLSENVGLGLTKTTFITGAFGAWTGDLLSQSRHDGGLGLGTTATSAIFLVAILVVVVFLSITRRDVTEIARASTPSHAQVLVVASKTAATPALADAIRSRAEASPARFHLLVPNPAP